MSNNEQDIPPKQEVNANSTLTAKTEFFESASWKRLSPFSILFFLSKALSQVISNAIPALAPTGILILNSDSKATSALLVFAGAFVLLVSNAILQYFFFRYKVEDSKILIHEGVFKKNQRVIRFDKVQNINVLQPFYFKFFELVTLQLETAGSKNNEANLAGINSIQAEQIKQTILDYRSEYQEKSNLEQTQPPEEDEVLSTASTKDLFKFGLTSNGMFWFFVFMAPIFGMMDKIVQNSVNKETVKLFVEHIGGGLSGGITLGTIVVLGIFILMITFSVLGAIFRYHNYKLTFKDDTLKRHSGLLGTHEESAKLPKIQAFINQTNFIGRWLNVENIILKQASGAQNTQSARAKLFVIPTLNRKKSTELLDFILHLKEFHPQLKKIDKRYIIKTWLILMLIPLVISLTLFMTSDSATTLLILLAGLLLLPLIYLRWKNFGYALDENFATFRSGFLGFRRITFPLFKAQRVVISQSPMQKRRNLATLKIYLASDRIEIPYIPIQHAQEWFDQISFKIETTKQNWF